MADPLSFIADPAIAKHAVSPLEGRLRKGAFNVAAGKEPGVILAERFGIAIAEVASWRGREGKCRSAIKVASGITVRVAPGSGSFTVNASAFNIGPGRWLVSGEKRDLLVNLASQAGPDGTVTELSHGRTVIRIDGPKSRWVLSKLFAVDLSDAALANGDGLATAHHDIHAQIQRVGPDAFDIYVFRSFARSFWHLLCRSAEEVGYRVD